MGNENPPCATPYSLLAVRYSLMHATMTVMGATKRVLKFVVGLVVPHSVVVVGARLRRRRLNRARRKRLDEAAARSSFRRPVSFDYQDAVRFLVQRGIDGDVVLQGSMPEASLHYCAALLAEHLEAGPVLGVQIGNFLGLSLAYFTHVIAARHEHSRVVSIDPNIPHLGVDKPAAEALALLEHFGLQGHTLMLTGYTLEKNLSNHGFIYAGYDPLKRYDEEVSCEHQLEGLALWSRNAFHFCVIDGNHDAAYLRREVEWIDQLLHPGGLLILDDVTEVWEEIRRVHATMDRTRYLDLGSDGRVAVLKKRVIVNSE